MRKILSLGLLALILTTLSVPVLAGSDDADYWCTPIKNDPAYKSLYGLCNAYWTETDPGKRIEILAAFEAKAGENGVSMPGLDAETWPCPCWLETDLVAECSSIVVSTGFADVVNGRGYAANYNASVSFQQVSLGFCQYVNGPLLINTGFVETTAEEQVSCVEDIAWLLDSNSCVRN